MGWGSVASSFFNNFTCNILHCRINDIRNIIYNAWNNCIIILNGPCTSLHIKVSIGTKIFVMLILQQKIIVADEPVKKNQNGKRYKPCTYYHN